MYSFAKNRAILIICALLACSVTFAGNAPDFYFRNLSVKDGLPSNMVTAICQDREGLMWFATGSGLSCHDGVSVTACGFEVDGRVDRNLSVNDLVVDGDGRVWAATDRGVYTMRPGEEHVFRKLMASAQDGSSSDTIALHLAADMVGNIWIATSTRGVYRYDVFSEKLTHYVLGAPGVGVEAMMVDSNNSVMVSAARNYGVLFVYNPATDSFHESPYSGAGGSSPRVLAMGESSTGVLYFGTWDEGVLRYDKARRTAVPVGSAEGLMHIHSLIEFAPGELLVGSDDGLMWMDVVTGERRLFVNDQSDQSSISNRFVYPVVRDHEGGLWIGTYFGGVNYVSPHSSSFERMSMSKLVGSSEGFLVSTFCEDRDGNLWIGSDNGGVIQYSPFTGRMLKSYTPLSDKAGLPSYNIHALLAEDDCLWIGGYGNGPYRVDLRTGKLKSYNQSSVYSLIRLADGTMLAGTMTDIRRYDDAQDRFVTIMEAGEIVVDIKQSADGKVWAASSGKGLFCMDPETGEWTGYTVDDGLVSDWVNCVYPEPESKLWIGTRNGLCRYDQSTGKFEKIALGVDCDALFLTGDGSRIWVTTVNGLLSYDLSTGTVNHYGTTEGIINEQFMVNSGLMASDGRIFVGTTTGFHSFYPHNIYLNRYVPPVIVRSFTVNGESKPTDGRTRLPHTSRDIMVSYAALSYCSPEENAYRYKLEGYDKEWHEAGNRTSALYTKLPGGKYRFVVTASNNDGLWNEEGTSFSFSVKPHPLASPLALVLYILMGAAASTGIFLYNKRKYQKHYSERFHEAIKTRDEQDMAAKIQFVTMIAHEVRTPLSLITAPLENILGRREELTARTAEDLDVIDKNSRRLLKLINQLLDFSRVTASGGMALDYAPSNVVELVKSVCERFMPSIEKSGVDFNFYCQPESLEAWLDPEAFTKVVSNLLSNAIKYTRDTVSLSLSVDDGGETFSVVISDNGRGMSALERKKLFTPFYRVDESKPGTGIGLVIVKQVVEAHSGTVIVNSTEGSGSEFLVTLPVHRDLLESALAEATDTQRPEPPAKEADAVVEDISSKEPYILIVEDDDDMRRFLVAEFSGEYKVVSAANGDVAKEILKEKNISLILSDWMMPGTDGAQLCSFVREDRNLCHIPFILLTAKADDSSVLESLGVGADAHVKKPFSPEHLHALVAHLLKMRGMLVRKYSSSAPLPKGLEEAVALPEKDLMTRVNEIVAANISNTELSVEMLCSELGMSRSALFTKVKAASGTTPNNIIMEARLKSSAALLTAGKYSIAEISYMVGFNSPSYFSKCFQRQYGMTPHDWLESNR